MNLLLTGSALRPERRAEGSRGVVNIPILRGIASARLSCHRRPRRIPGRGASEGVDRPRLRAELVLAAITRVLLGRHFDLIELFRGTVVSEAQPGHRLRWKGRASGIRSSRQPSVGRRRPPAPQAVLSSPERPLGMGRTFPQVELRPG
ncbi:hypothetical protein ACIQM3_19445 [Streptomyces sp. NPDC091271]|uniref:hypothetical protein n=1 Tax=Streptomyces sp. NPDC091271 TaxID=3365980 RepID=UPI003811FE6D